MKLTKSYTEKQIMSTQSQNRENLISRTIVILTMIALAATLRVMPHPWNFTPVGAMALFSAAAVKDPRLSSLLPLAPLFAGDLFARFHKLMPIVYASPTVHLALAYTVSDHCTIA